MKKISSTKSLLNGKNFKENKELLERHEVENTPFTIIGTEGKYFGSMGKFRITEPKGTKEEIEKELGEITWNRIVQIILLLLEVVESEADIKNALKK